MSNIHIHLTVSEVGADNERLDYLTRRLMNDLSDVGVESIKRPDSGSVPEGTMSSTPLTWAELAIVALPAFLPNLFAFLQAWTLRGENRKVKIKTPSGLEVEFNPGEPLSQNELLSLVKKLMRAQEE